MIRVSKASGRILQQGCSLSSAYVWPLISCILIGLFVARNRTLPRRASSWANVAAHARIAIQPLHRNLWSTSSLAISSAISWLVEKLDFDSGGLGDCRASGTKKVSIRISAPVNNAFLPRVSKFRDLKALEHKNRASSLNNKTQLETFQFQPHKTGLHHDHQKVGKVYR